VVLLLFWLVLGGFGLCLSGFAIIWLVLGGFGLFPILVLS